MRRKSIATTKEVTKTVFELLLAGGLVITLGSLNNRNADKLVRGFTKYSVYRIRETIKRLRLQRMVMYDAEDEMSPIILSEKGMRRALHYRFLDIFSGQRKWDHFWRIVMFDISERSGKRRSFQRALKNAGFYRIQDSVYVTPYDLELEIRQYARTHEINGGILCATTPSLGPLEYPVRQHYLLSSKSMPQ